MSQARRFAWRATAGLTVKARSSFSARIARQVWTASLSIASNHGRHAERTSPGARGTGSGWPITGQTPQLVTKRVNM